MSVRTGFLRRSGCKITVTQHNNTLQLLVHLPETCKYKALAGFFEINIIKKEANKGCIFRGITPWGLICDDSAKRVLDKFIECILRELRMHDTLFWQLHMRPAMKHVLNITKDWSKSYFNYQTLVL